MAKVSILSTVTLKLIPTYKHFLLLNPNMVMGVTFTFINTESHSYRDHTKILTDGDII